MGVASNSTVKDSKMKCDPFEAVAEDWLLPWGSDEFPKFAD